MDNKDILLTKLAVAFNRNIDDAYLATYEEYLQDMPYELLNIVIDNMVVKNKFMPTVHELLEEAYNIHCERAGIKPLSAGELLKLFKKRVCKGTAKEAFKDNKALLDVAKKFGWQRFKNTNPAYDNQTQKELYGYYLEALEGERILAMKNLRTFMAIHPDLMNPNIKAKMIGDVND